MAVSLYSTAIKEGYAPEPSLTTAQKILFHLLAIYKELAEGVRSSQHERENIRTGRVC